MTDGSGGRRELWLVRHGETPASRGRVLAGWMDVPLTEHGEDQARALRPVLGGRAFDGVWCSDLLRTVTTARLAWEGAAVRDLRLREMSFGTLEGRAWDTLEPAWQEAMLRFTDFAPPEGETFDALRRRVLDFVDGLAAGRHLVFTHGGVLRLLSREAGEDHFVPTGSLLVVDWESRRIVRRRDGESEGSRSRPPAATGEEE
jgi:probable phosphoglycerate mutase